MQLIKCLFIFVLFLQAVACEPDSVRDSPPSSAPVSAEEVEIEPKTETDETVDPSQLDSDAPGDISDAGSEAQIPSFPPSSAESTPSADSEDEQPSSQSEDQSASVQVDKQAFSESVKTKVCNQLPELGRHLTSLRADLEALK